MDLYILIIAATVSCVWFLLSLRPGSLLGFAFTSGDWARLLRGTRRGTGHDKGLLRSAGLRSALFHCLLAILLAASHLALGVAVITGILSGYGILLANSRTPDQRTRA